MLKTIAHLRYSPQGDSYRICNASTGQLFEMDSISTEIIKFLGNKQRSIEELQCFAAQYDVEHDDLHSFLDFLEGESIICNYNNL